MINIFENVFKLNPGKGFERTSKTLLRVSLIRFLVFFLVSTLFLVSYQIDRFSGNCSVQLLAKDPNNLTVDDMQMTDPLHLFHMDKKFAYNGEHLDRSIMMGFFAGEEPIKEGSYENLTTIVKMSSAGYLVEEDGQNGLLIPAGVIQYPTAVSLEFHSLADVQIPFFRITTTSPNGQPRTFTVSQDS